MADRDETAQIRLNRVTLRIQPASMELSFWQSPGCQRFLSFADFVALAFSLINNIAIYLRVEQSPLRKVFAARIMRISAALMGVAALSQLYMFIRHRRQYKRWRWHIFFFNRVIRLVAIIIIGWCIEENLLASRQLTELTIKKDGVTLSALKVDFTMSFAFLILQHALVNPLDFRTVLLFQTASVVILFWMYAGSTVQCLGVTPLQEGWQILFAYLDKATHSLEQVVSFAHPDFRVTSWKDQQVFLVLFTQLYFGCVLPLFILYQVELALKLKYCKRLTRNKALLSTASWFVLWFLLSSKLALCLTGCRPFRHWSIERWEAASGP